MHYYMHMHAHTYTQWEKDCNLYRQPYHCWAWDAKNMFQWKQLINCAIILPSFLDFHSSIQCSCSFSFFWVYVYVYVYVINEKQNSISLSLLFFEFCLWIYELSRGFKNHNLVLILSLRMNKILKRGIRFLQIFLCLICLIGQKHLSFTILLECTFEDPDIYPL